MKVLPAGLSVAVTVTLLKVPAVVGVPVMVAVVEPGVSVSPGGRPVADHVQQVGIVGSVSVAVNVAPE